MELQLSVSEWMGPWIYNPSLHEDTGGLGGDRPYLERRPIPSSLLLVSGDAIFSALFLFSPYLQLSPFS